MTFLQSDRKTILFMLVIYLISNFFFLLNYNGIYWDDWALIRNSFETISNMYVQSVGAVGYLSSILNYIIMSIGNGIFFDRILTVICLFSSGIFVYKILQTLSFISKEDRFFITMFFLLAPIYSAKVSLLIMNFLYVTLFYFGFYLISKYIDNLGLMKRVLILCIFFLSFLNNAILVFYAIVLVYVFYKLYNRKTTYLNNLSVFVKTKVDFILLPVIFYIIKSIYFVPSGIYQQQGYNKINIENILNLNNYYHTFLWSFIDPIKLSVENISPFIIIAFVLLLLLSNLFSRQNNEMNKKDIYLLIIGFVVFFLGSFAYLAVGKVPNLNDWESRFQVLLPIGFSFILYYGIQIISNLLNFKVVIKYFLYLILIISFVSFHLKEQLKYNIDWFYQQSIIENFKISEQIIQNSTFVVENELYSKLAKSRVLRYYELNGMSKDAFSKDDKLFVSNENQITLLEDLKTHKEMNYSLWEKEPPIYFKMKENPNVPFNKGQVQTLKYFFMLKYLEIFNQIQFKKEIKNLVFFEFK